MIQQVPSGNISFASDQLFSSATCFNFSLCPKLERVTYHRFARSPSHVMNDRLFHTSINREQKFAAVHTMVIRYFFFLLSALENRLIRWRFGINHGIIAVFGHYIILSFRVFSFCHISNPINLFFLILIPHKDLIEKI